MPLAIDSTESGGTGHGGANPTSPLTWSFTNTAGNVLFVGVAFGWNGTGTATQNASVTGVTYNSVAMTKVTSIGFTTVGSFTADEISLWSLVNPATGAHTVSVSFQGDGDTTQPTWASIEAGAISFSGGNTTTPTGTPVTAKFDTGAGTTSLSATLSSSTTGNFIIDCLGCGSGGAASSSGTIRWSLTSTGTASNAAIEGVSSTKASPGGSTTMGYTITQDYAGLIAVEINAAGGVVSTVEPPMRTMRGVGI